MNRKRIILRFLCAALLLSGLGLLLYPSVNAWLEKRKIGQHVEAFRNTVTALQQSGGKAVSATATMEESAPPYAELLEAMEAYNESIFADKQAGFCDPWSYQAPVFDLAEYGIEDGIVGILSIPKMDLELPIYLGNRRTLSQRSGPTVSNQYAHWRRKHQLRPGRAPGVVRRSVLPAY